MSIRDIAKEANVSIATVSRVINNKEGVSEKVREQIQKIITEQNFVPNTLSRGLMSKKSNAVGVLVPSLENNHFAVTANIVQIELQKNGFSMMLGCTGDEPETVETLLRDFISRQVDGLIFIGSTYDNAKVKKMIENIPEDIKVVMANSSNKSKRVTSILVEVTSGIFECCQHLINNGHKEILFITGVKPRVSTMRKLEGYKKALEKNNLDFDESKVLTCLATEPDAYELIVEKAPLLKKVTAIVCGTDDIAIGVIKGLKELNINVPNDICVTGYNNSAFSNYTNPTITTVDNKHKTVGSMAVNMFLQSLKDNSFDGELTIKPTLVIRESSERSLK